MRPLPSLDQKALSSSQHRAVQELNGGKLILSCVCVLWPTINNSCCSEMTRGSELPSAHPPPAASTCSLPPTPLGDRCPSLCLGPEAPACCIMPCLTRPRQMLTSCVKRFLPTAPNQTGYNVAIYPPPAVLSLTPAPRRMQASWTGRSLAPSGLCPAAAADPMRAWTSSSGTGFCDVSDVSSGHWAGFKGGDEGCVISLLLPPQPSFLVQ